MTEIPADVMKAAPRVWIEHGPEMRSRVIDPVWRQKMMDRLAAIALLAAERQAALQAEKREEERRAAREQNAAENERLRLERKRRRAKRDREARADGMRAMRLLVETIAQQHDVTGAEIRGSRLFDRLTAPRQHAAYELRRTGLSLTAIGGLLHRDHTTVLASIRRWPARAATMGIPCEPLPDFPSPIKKVRMTAPVTSHARALEIVEAARVALNVFLDVEVADAPKDIWDLIRERALPLVISVSDVSRYVGQFLHSFDEGQGDWPHLAEDGRYYVSRMEGDEDVGWVLDVDRGHAFATQEDCHRYIVAVELPYILEILAEHVAPDMPKPEFDKFLDRLGYAEIRAFREARVGSVDASVARAA